MRFYERFQGFCTLGILGKCTSRYGGLLIMAVFREHDLFYAQNIANLSYILIAMFTLQ